MRTHRFLRDLEHDRIVRAIKEAEAKTSGQIRVFLQRGKFEEDALERAQKKFVQLGMNKTRERNAILILVAPRAQKFAVVGDEGVHEKCGENFWHAISPGPAPHPTSCRTRLWKAKLQRRGPWAFPGASQNLAPMPSALKWRSSKSKNRATFARANQSVMSTPAMTRGNGKGCPKTP